MRAMRPVLPFLIPCLFLPSCGQPESAPPAASAAQQRFDREGCHSLFDGRTLAGWTTTLGVDESLAPWTVEDRALVGTLDEEGRGDLITTERAFKSYILKLDVKVEGDVEASIYPRVRAHAKVCELRIGDSAMGTIFAEEENPVESPAAAQAFRPGEWNHVERRCYGERMYVEAWRNGTRLSDFQGPPRGDLDFERWPGTGAIGLGIRQDPGAPGKTGRVRFGDVVFRQLPDFDPAHFTVDDRGFLSATTEGQEVGWVQLFNGTDLEGWETTGGASAAVVRDGVLELPAEGPPGLIRTLDDRDDFQLLIDFQIGYMADSGIILRGDRAAPDPSKGGCEIQIVDDHSWEEATSTPLDPRRRTGSILDAHPPGVFGVLRPREEWNTYFMGYLDDIFSVKLNGQFLYQSRVTMLEVEPHFSERALTGYVGIEFAPSEHLRDGEYIRFRNIWARPISVEDFPQRNR